MKHTDRKKKPFTNVPPQELSVTPEHWDQTPAVVKGEIVRALTELNRGVAIKKDQLFDRPKNAVDGFYGLTVAEDRLRRLQHAGASSDEIAKVQERIARLRSNLSKDVEVYRDVLTAIAVWQPLAEAHGTTIQAALDRYMSLERRLMSDFTGTLFEIMDFAGMDPMAVIEWARNAPQRDAPHA